MQKLPTRLAKNLVTLRNARGQMVHILGTSHFSKQSCEDAQTVISTLNPAGVFLELCGQRKAILDPSFDYATMLSARETVNAFRSGNTNRFALMYTLLMQYYKLEPGKEFITAADEARKLNIPVFLGDRQIGITCKRIWQGLTFWQKITLVRHFFTPLEGGISNRAVSEFAQNKQGRGYSSQGQPMVCGKFPA